MRPRRLTFEGINSFEKKQDIDFARLTEAHLFGIFGPTGAGKSTILDAMTLALYGEVVRAPHRTGGILNTRCDNLFVELEFSLGAGGDGERVYRVVRQYARDRGAARSGDALKVKKCSLRRVDGDAETVICAEKSFDVTQKVRELLGLTMDDFVHSVVLPQGQFAEFLNMTGKDRRDMLERLFHLEDFGRALTDKVRERENSLQARAGEVGAALRELGEVSEAALKEARVRRELDSDELKRVEERSSVADREAEGLRALYERVQERKTWQVRKMEHDAARGRMSELNAELDAARRADQVLPLAAELEKLDRELTDQRRSAHESARAHENACDYNDKVIAEAETKRPALLKEQQDGQKRLGALETLKPRQDDMSRLSADERAMLDRLAEIRRQSEANDHALEEKQQAVIKGEAFVAQQEAIIASCAGKDMEKLAEGAQLERSMNDCQTRYSEALKLMEERAGELERCEAALEQARQNEREGLKSLNAARRELSRAEEEYIASATRHAAAELARGLSEGKPCPVCGSVHHPAPAADGAQAVDGREPARAAVDERQKAYSDTVRELARLGQDCESRQQAQSELRAQAESLHQELGELTARWGELCIATGSSSLAQSYAQALEAQSRAGDANRLLSQARARLDSYRRQVRDYEMERLKLHNLVDALTDKLKENQRAASGWAGELKRLGLPVDADINVYIDECRERLESIGHKLDKMDAALKDARHRLEDTQRRAAEQNARLEEMERQREERRTQLADKLNQCRFADVQSALRARRPVDRIAELELTLRRDSDEQLLIDSNLKRLAETEDEREVSDAEMSAATSRAGQLRERVKELTASLGALERDISDMSARLKRKAELEAGADKLQRALDSVTELKQVLRGNALVEYVANQYLSDITRMAGEKLMFLTGNRYDLELSEDGFTVRDMERGGTSRATSTLSGGETFLVSLALALSLSMHINLRGQPLGFFFLDEGFGTLDDRLLSTVMEALGMLARENFSIGVISHVNALKERIPAQLIVSGGANGSQAHIEFA